ncbi:PQQ-binding-like beta-propeller repeat protein [Streptomyces sp. NPDC051561]|uniref:outer membrane protein assembly factor BamB family protein n=1 Tax=Streptomyces sp. NPDC051561 TaxID=3365658 RepID=UPI00378B1A69
MAVLLLFGGVAGCGTTGSAGKNPSASGTPTPSPTRPASTEAVEILRETVPEVDGDDFVGAKGTWLAGTTYASAIPYGVAGYESATGRKLWTLPLSGDICESSRDANRSGLVAVVHRASKDPDALCTQMSLINLTTGTQVWRKPVPESVAAGFNLNVNVASGIAAAGWPEGSVAYQATPAGQQVWKSAPAGCTNSEYHGTEALYSVAYCDRTFRVERRAGDTGRVEWTYSLPRGEKGPKAVWVVSTSPLVLATVTPPGEDSDVDGPDKLLSITPQGTVGATIDLGKRKYETGCTDGDGTCDGVVVSKGTIYLATHAKNFSVPNALVAFDAGSGARKWSAPAPGSGTYIPVRSQDGEPMAYQSSEPLRGPRLVRMDRETGHQTLVLRMPPEKNMDSSLLVTKTGAEPALYAHGRLHLHHGGSYLPGDAGKILMSAIYAPKPSA